MRKQLLLMLILCFSTWIIRAERIDVATARQVAQSVAQQGNVTGGLRSTANVSLVYAAAPGKNGSVLRSGTVDGTADYFVFNFSGNKGFAIVSGEDRVRPILGYSHKGSFDPDNLPDNLRGMLAFYQEQITQAIHQGIEATPEISAEWNRYLSGTMPQTRAKTISTALWAQGEPFNLQTPTVNGEHTLTGCVATAMGIIMKHHQYPAKAVNPPTTNTYQVNGRTQSQTITYGAYDWNNMLDSYRSSYSDTEANAVATLLYHCGANVKMNYGLSSSGASTSLAAKALRDVFGYSPSIRYLTKEAYRWEEWKQMLKDELDAGYPVIYDGQNPSQGGHAFVCDGYDNNDFFSINWGWGGYQNGFYVLSTLNGFSEDQGMTLNIRPQTSGETYYMRPYLTSAQYSGNGKNINVNFGMKYYALDDHDFYIELGVVDQDNKIIKTQENPKLWKLSAYPGGWKSWSNQTRSTTLSTDLSDGQRVTLLCSLDGTNWEVMRALDNVPLGIGNEQITPEPDDPDDPEQPLNVNIMWNQFDDTFLQASGLDATQHNYQNTNGICYMFTTQKENENVILHYTIANYNQWDGHLAIYYGDYDIYEGGKGTPVTITNSSFDIRLTPEDMKEGYYVNYLKVYSDKVGELSYTIQVKSESASSPALEETGKKMIFVKELKGEFAPNPIQGTVNDEIPFAIKFTDIDKALTGKNLSLSINIQGMTKDQVELFDAAGKKIELTVSEYNKNRLLSKNPVAVGRLTENKSYPFKIKINTASFENTPYINITPLVDGKNVPFSYIGTDISINPDEPDPATYTVTLPTVEGATIAAIGSTTVEEGNNFSFTVTVKEGYNADNMVVKANGSTLQPNATGHYTIENIRSNMVVTVSGIVKETDPDEPDPATYTVTLPVVEGATIAAIGSTTVEEGNNFSFTVTVKDGYNADNMVVKANGITLLPDAAGRYTIEDIRSNMVVTVSGIVKEDEPTANEAIETEALRVWSTDKQLFIQTTTAETAHIVTPDGRLYKTLYLPAGKHTEEMPQGIYIVRIGNQSFKLKF